jgi:cytochrome P450
VIRNANIANWFFSFFQGCGAFRLAMTPTRDWHYIYDKKFFKAYFAASEDVLNFDEFASYFDSSLYFYSVTSHFDSSATVFFSHVFGDVYNTGEPAWLENYKKVLTSGLWRSNQLDIFEQKMTGAIEDQFEKRWSAHAASGAWFDLGEEIHRITALVNLRALMGQSALDTFGDQWQILMPELDTLATNQIVMNAPNLPFGPSKRFQTIRSEILKMMEDVWVNICQDARDKFSEGEATRGTAFDCYAELIAAGWDGKVSNNTIMMHLLAIMFAAHVNTANSLIWAIANIVKRPGYVQRVLDDNINGDTSFSANCLKEAARVYPILGVFRMATKDGFIEGTNFWARKGDLVSATPIVSHFDADIFPDPQAFKPERFEDEQAMKAAGLGFLAFGAGTHRCLGEKYVSRIARKCLQNIFSRYEIELQKTDLPKPVWTTTSDPSPAESVMIRIKARV